MGSSPDSLKEREDKNIDVCVSVGLRKSYVHDTLCVCVWGEIIAGVASCVFVYYKFPQKTFFFFLFFFATLDLLSGI